VTATQLDLFGTVEAAGQRAADWKAERARLMYERLLFGTDLGYGLCSEAASGWPNGVPAGAEAAIDACYAEQERASLGQLVPGAPGSCRRCDHATICHYVCRFACEAKDCACSVLTDPVVEHLRVEVLPGAVLSVRTIAEVMTERWARYNHPWPGIERAAKAEMETIN